MAQRAILRGCNVAVVLLGHRRRSIVTMALFAVINNTGMIKYRWFKGAGHVTETAILRGRDVAVVLLGYRTRSIITMTFCAVIDPAGMVKGSVREITGVMAHAAILSVRCRMSRRCSSSSSWINMVSIVARGTITGNPRVIEK